LFGTKYKTRASCLVAGYHSPFQERGHVMFFFTSLAAYFTSKKERVMGPQEFGFRPLSLSALDHESICHPPPRPCFF